eukprot:m.71201 g.71201  ORF g.71201 m.71201 type:complete len:418 (-) comp20144_c0_seq1:74-1327(-)
MALVKMSSVLMMDVAYRGFVFVDTPVGTTAGPTEVKAAEALFANPKKTRKVNPQFCCGQPKPVSLVVALEGFELLMPNNKKNKDSAPALLQVQSQMIGFVHAIKRTVYVLLHRSATQANEYACHCFVIKNEKKAQELASSLANTTRSAVRNNKPETSETLLRKHTLSSESLSMPTSSTESIPEEGELYDNMNEHRDEEDLSPDSSLYDAPEIANISSPSSPSSPSDLYDAPEIQNLCQSTSNVYDLAQVTPVGKDDESGYMMPRASMSMPHLNRKMSDSPVSCTFGQGSSQMSLSSRSPSPPLRRPSCPPSAMEARPWFFGVLKRGEAEELLAGHPVGTYLVRVASSRNGYSISVVNTQSQVAHFMVQKEDTTRNSSQVFVAGHKRKFTTVSELLSHYSRHALTVDDDKLGSPLTRK